MTVADDGRRDRPAAEPVAARRRSEQRRAAAALADPQVRDAAPLEEVTEAIYRPGLRLAEIVAAIMTGYAERPAIAQRAAELITDASGRRTRSLLPRYETTSYRKLWSAASALAACWQRSPDAPVRAGDFVCTLGFVSADYVTVDLACIHLGAVSVPLQSSGTVSQWASIMNEVEPQVLATSVEHLGAAVEAAVTGTAPQRILVFDYHSDDDAQREQYESAARRLAEAGLHTHLETLTAAIEIGRTQQPATLHVPSADEDPLSLLIYTSGSTGAPKGAMYGDRLVAGRWLVGRPRQPRITFSYMPMSHSAGRTNVAGTFAAGGTVYLAAASDMSTFFDDLALARPTELFLVPRVCEMFFQRHQAAVERQVAAGAECSLADAAVKAVLREQALGGRYLRAVFGTAPLSAPLREFMESMLETELHNGYSSTEVGGGVLMDNRIRRPPVIEYKLADVPELGYFGTDKPYPRGELLLKATSMFGGYFRRPEVTAEMFDADGFYRTGDVMAEIGPDHLEFLDRRNNVLKLAQGEFVSIARLETLYAGNSAIRQIFLHGSGEHSYLLAVVVPTDQTLAAPDPKSVVRAALRQVAEDAQLNSYEIPRDFLVESQPFTIENGLLSGVGKPLRPELKARYGEQLEQVHAELERQRVNELAALRAGAAERPVFETVALAIGAVLGHSGDAVRADAHFSELGGDSLAALSVSALLEEAFTVQVPVGMIIGPATDVRRLAGYIEAERSSSGQRPSVASVHGLGSEVRAADLTLEKFFDPAQLGPPTDDPDLVRPIRVVLLTGATGYLGRFLCLEWLRRLDDAGGTLICLVRGEDAAAARRRLDAAFDTGDPVLLREYHDLAERRLRVVPGDVAEPNFGLGDEHWRQLADRVDLIVHSAALVNHVLPYGQLFGPNVVGTAEVIRLALTNRRKPISFLSSVAVAAGPDRARYTEYGDIREVSPTRELGGAYASGYGTSKWAGEVLLREAHDSFGVPVAVFRSDMILAHSRYTGQLNVPDSFTRLLLSLLTTGIAPKSFYQTDERGDRVRSHYDGLPADFTAAAITEIGARIEGGFATFDVLNPHDDGVSLDEFVDWLIEDGEAITRIDDYSDWLGRFETALRALPDQQRIHTSLPLLDSLRRPLPAMRGSALPATEFQTAVRRIKVTESGEIPHLDRALIRKYVADLRRHGLA